MRSARKRSGVKSQHEYICNRVPFQEGLVGLYTVYRLKTVPAPLQSGAQLCTGTSYDYKLSGTAKLLPDGNRQK